MGLAGVKNKTKIGDDPNNTKWARNTQTFGHKILRSQGWEPGQYLGQKDAAHAANYTAASSSYIRTVLRQENLGVGAAGPGGNTADQCTGLDVFKDLLGRLNGKSETVIEKQRQARESVKMTLYVERRYGPMRFVRGGYLIGEDETTEKTPEMTEKPVATTETAKTDAEATPSSETTPTSSSESTPSTSDTEAESDTKEARRKAKKERKEEKKEKSRKRKASSDDDEEAGNSERKEKKRKRSKDDGDDDEKAEKKRRKQEKKERKELKEKEKREKKENKEKKKEKKDKRRKASADEMDVDSATPSESEKAVPAAFAAARSSGNLARRRFINSKRAAVSDPQALKQIFMIKA